MICKLCKTLIADNSVYCPECGGNLAALTAGKNNSLPSAGSSSLRVFLYNALLPGLGYVYLGKYFLGNFYIFLSFVFYLIFFKAASGAASYMENQIVNFQLFVISFLILILIYAKVLYTTKKMVKEGRKSAPAYKRILTLAAQTAVIVILSVLINL